ncbi:MAG: hypothetical protein E6G35_18270 [Actinobacteria bacterium]|nr:MAG: hypothetical protein E6G35_18270 [Actinomycetota bacterium]
MSHGLTANLAVISRRLAVHFQHEEPTGEAADAAAPARYDHARPAGPGADAVRRGGQQAVRDRGGLRPVPALGPAPLPQATGRAQPRGVVADHQARPARAATPDAADRPGRATVHVRPDRRGAQGDRGGEPAPERPHRDGGAGRQLGQPGPVPGEFAHGGGDHLQPARRRADHPAGGQGDDPHRASPVSIELIQEIHRIVTDGTLDDASAAGRFQRPDEPRVVVGDQYHNVFHIPPPAADLPERLALVCDFANGAIGDTYIPGVIRAIIVHFMLGYEHPFEDGNGRTARALFYWIMLNEDYWLTEFLSISRILKNAPSRYGNSFIHTEQDDNDLTYFILYQLTVLQRAIRELNAYLERKVAEVREFQQALPAVPGEFNHRQLALLQHALRHPGAQYTVHSHGTSHEVVRQTARQDLFDLERRQLLTRHLRGRTFVWSPVADLVDKLKA